MIVIDYQTTTGRWEPFSDQRGGFGLVRFTTPEEARKYARERCAYWRLIREDTGEVIDSRER